MTTPEPRWTNAEWLAGLRTDREAMWAAIRGRVHRGLLAYVRRHPPRDMDARALEALAEDATQETLLTVRAKLHTFRDESRFTTWVYRIAVNALLAEIRRLRWAPRASDNIGGALPDWPLDDRSTDPERDALQREAWALIRGLIENELSPRQRGVLFDHVFRDKPLDVVAADLGTSRDAVYKTIHDARRKLRAALLARGLTLQELRRIFE